MIIERYGVRVDLSYEHKTTCPRCFRNGGDASGDNLHVYGEDNGKHLGAFCFACEYTIPSEEWLEENGEEEEVVVEMKGEWSKEKFEQVISNTTTESKGWRGIRQDTARDLGIRFEYCTRTGEVENVYFPVTQGSAEGLSGFDALTGYKIRTKDKKFFSVGSFSKESDLFGQARFKSASNWLVITAGEIDCASVYQMLKDHNKGSKYEMPAVVSSVIGEKAGHEQIRKHFEWISRFKRIIIIYDEDKTGYEGEENVARVLPKDVPLYVVKLRYNDCNDYLENGKESEFISDYFGMRPRTMDGVKSSFDAFNEIEELDVERIPLPKYMHRMEGMMGGGMKQGSISNVVSYTSLGKSTHVNRMVYHWIFNSPIVPTIVSLEATAAEYVVELMGIHLGRNLSWEMTGGEIVEFLKTPEGIKAREDLCYDEKGNPRFYIIDERTGDIFELEKQIERIVKMHNSQLIVIDTLSDLIRGSSADHAEDHMKFQRVMVKEGVTFVNVLHTRKPSLNKEGKENKVTEYDALGSGSFVQSAAYNIVLNRDKIADCDIERNSTEVTLAKCRGGKTGDAGHWYYDFKTTLCHDREDWLKENPHMVPREGE